MARYIVVDGTVTPLKIINVVEWDGSTPWTPPAGCTAEQNGTAQTGDVFESLQWVTPSHVPTAREQRRLDSQTEFAAAADAERIQILGRAQGRVAD